MAEKLDNWQHHVKAKWPLDAPIVFGLSRRMQRKSFGDIVIEEMAARGWSAKELQRRSGVSYDVIAKLKQRPGSSTSSENGQKLALALGLDWPVADGSGMPMAGLHENPEPFGSTLVPVYDVQASAGHGNLVDAEDHVSSLAFPADYLRKLTRANPKDLKIITVKGDSMLPTLNDDDVVMLDTSKKDLSYDGLFVLRDNGDGLLVKRIGRASKSGFVSLISDNRVLYPTVERAIEDIQVIGKVLWQGRKV